MAIDTSTYDVPVARSVEALRGAIQAWRREGYSVGFVPTMGALHAGHLSLVDLAAREADKVVVSIFVNPTQFAAGEDLMSYPRTEPDDAAKLSKHPAHLIFAPNAQEMYRDGFSTTVSVSGVGEGLETAHRPHFFNGVATVVTKLLLQVMPDCAVFGEKDYQQLLVVKRLVQDLDIPVEILGGPICREKDGLAMSSRNAYLAPEDRKTAGILNKLLAALADQLRKGMPVKQTLEAGRTSILAAGYSSIDYLELCDAETLEPLTAVGGPARLLVAARLGKVRLLDNMGI